MTILDFEKFKVQDLNFDKTNFQEKFQEFWELFPTSDKFLHYNRTRILRTEQDKCRKMYKKYC